MTLPRRHVIFHDFDGDYRLAAETRAREIRRAMDGMGRVDGVDYTVEVYPVNRAAQVSRALRFGKRPAGSGPWSPPATSVDFFNHAGSQAIFLDLGAVGAGTNLAPGSQVELSPVMTHPATPFRKALPNVQPWGEITVHGCNFGRGEGGRPSGARQLANAVDVTVNAYPQPGGTIFTHDPTLAAGLRDSRRAEREGRGVTDVTKPVWMVPFRENRTARIRTFVPRSMVRWVEGRGPYLAGRPPGTGHVAPSVRGGGAGWFTATAPPTSRFPAVTRWRPPPAPPVLQSRPDWFTASSAPSWGQSRLGTPARAAQPWRTPPPWSAPRPASSQSRPDVFTARSRPAWSQSRPASSAQLMPRYATPQSRPDVFTATTTPSWGRSIAPPLTPRLQPVPVLQRCQPDWFTPRSTPSYPQSHMAVPLRSVPSPVLQQSQPDWFTPQTGFGQSRAPGF